MYLKRILLKLQKRAARIILQADFMTPSQLMFQELGWLTFPKRIQYHIGDMVFKSLNGLAPEYLTNLLTKPSQMHGRNLRSNDKEILKKSLFNDNILRLIVFCDWTSFLELTAI